MPARSAAARSERGTRAESAPTEAGTAEFLRVPSDERLDGHRPTPVGVTAVNRRLGVPQSIASTPREYVSKAVEVASNADLRQALRRQILETGAELFEDAAVVREHDEYFAEAIAATRGA